MTSVNGSASRATSPQRSRSSSPAPTPGSTSPARSTSPAPQAASPAAVFVSPPASPRRPGTPVPAEAPKPSRKPLPAGNAWCAKIDGLKSAGKNLSMWSATPTANSTVGSYVGVPGSAQADGAFDRGLIEVRATPNPDRQTFTIHVDTFHAKPQHYGPAESQPELAGDDDKIMLVLQARVQDGDEEAILNVGILKDGPCNNAGPYRGKHTFRVSYDDVNNYLQHVNPNLKLTPGSQLAVWGNWECGHEWGGFGRKGEFDVPFPPKALTPTAARLAGVQGRQRASLGAAMPLDISYKIPDGLQKQHSTVLEQGGEITTRLESEMKAEQSEAEIENAVLSLYKMAADPTEAARVFGKGWSVAPVTRYWRKDDAGNVIESPRFAKYKAKDPSLANIVMGEPDPLLDQYKGKQLLEKGWAIRIRNNETKSGLLNVKPGLGRLDPKSLIRQRVEVGITLAPNAPEYDVARFIQYEKSGYNPAAAEFNDAFPNMYLPNQFEPVLELTAERHRFLFTHEDGVSVEFTGDFTRGKEVIAESRQPALLPDGTEDPANPRIKPRESYICGFEAELDHLNFGQGNQGSSTGFAQSVRTFSREEDQLEFGDKLTENATLSVPPRFHTTKDLDNDAFRENDSYKAFEGMLEKLKTHLFPQGVKPATQKGQAAAIAMGIINAPSEEPSNS